MLGGTGLFGPFVARQLADLGHDVTIFHTGEHEAELPLQVRHIHSPLGHRPMYDLPAELRSLSPDIILHMVTMTARDAQAAVNTFKGRAGRLIAISSADVYQAFGRVNGLESGPPDPLPLTEESPLRQKLYLYRGDTLRSDDDPAKY